MEQWRKNLYLAWLAQILTLTGFGFILPDDGGPEVFVHCNVLFRSGMTDLTPGQRVFVSAERVPRGIQATGIEPI